METAVKQTGQRYAKYFHEFEISIMSSFKSNEAWLQTGVLCEISPLYKVMESYVYFVYANM